MLEVTIRKIRMYLKVPRMMFWRIIKREWYLPNIPEITVDELYDRLNGNNPPLLVDLRYREHFEGRGQDKYEKNGHIRNAKWIPFMELSSRFQELHKFKNKEIVNQIVGAMNYEGMKKVLIKLKQSNS